MKALNARVLRRQGRSARDHRTDTLHQSAYQTAEARSPVRYDLVRRVQGAAHDSREPWGLPQAERLSVEDVPPGVARGYVAASDAVLKAHLRRLEREAYRRRMRAASECVPRPSWHYWLSLVIVLMVAFVLKVGVSQ